MGWPTWGRTEASCLQPGLTQKCILQSLAKISDNSNLMNDPEPELLKLFLTPLPRSRVALTSGVRPSYQRCPTLSLPWSQGLHSSPNLTHLISALETRKQDCY